MKTRVLPVLIVLAISLIATEARAAVVDSGKISTEPAIEAIDITACAIRPNSFSIIKQVEKQIASAAEIDYATGDIAIDNGVIDVPENSIPPIGINDINIARDIREIDEDADINRIVISSMIDIDASSIAQAISA